ncbi:MAG: hypothetical protein C4297_10425 [Gemmataceae bacterium]
MARGLNDQEEVAAMTRIVLGALWIVGGIVSTAQVCCPGNFAAGSIQTGSTMAKLAPQQIAQGWIMLFDGESKFGWHIPGDVKIHDGVLEWSSDQKATATCTTRLGAFEFELEHDTIDGEACSLEFFTGSQSLAAGSASSGEGWQVMRGRVEPAPVTEPEASSEISFEADRLVYKVQARIGGGPIGLRLHKDGGETIRIRKFNVRPLGLQPIFNGKDLTGWRVVASDQARSVFAVNDQGELTVRNGPGDLQTVDQWADFVLQLEIKTHGRHLNSGVFFRALPGQFWSGYEAQIRNQWERDDRNRPVDFGTGGIYNRQPARRVVSNDNEWFTMTIVAAGSHLATWVNGFQTADFEDTRPPANNARQGKYTGRGCISLQGHDPTTHLSFRNLRLASLPDTR